MTLSDQLKHPRADMRIQAKKKVEMIVRLWREIDSRKIHGGVGANANLEQLTLQWERAGWAP